MISIAGWEIRRTADKRTTVKRTAEKRSGEKRPAEKRPTEKRSGERQSAEKKPQAGSRTAGGRKRASGQGQKKAPGGQNKAPGGQKKAPATGKKQSAKSPAAETPTAKAQSAKARAAKSPTAKAQSAKTQSTKTQSTKAQPAKGQPTTGRTTKTPEPQGAPEKALLQRTSFGARFARVMVLLLAFVCMVGFAAALAKATLVPSPASVDLVHTNLHPGRSLRAYVDQPAFQDTVKQIGGNVLLGAPFGVLLPMLVPKARGAVRVVVVTALVMVAVETVQGLIVEGRAFDIDDVILNTSGALLGYVVVGRWLGHALHPRRRHWWHRWTRRGIETPPAA
ncbi:VanZ family protein [Streptomyces sp. NPDC059455]|uniref:VanZ family protein n=1 Tax=Streptomyces sp. NPDC059455 TaxID=3346837 RepID=UPI0036D0B0E8